MQAGLLREKITFYQLVKVKTETGSEDNTYVKYHDCRARVTYTSGDRENENGGLDFDELYRIEWDGDMYRILCIEKNKHNQSVKIVGEKVND